MSLLSLTATWKRTLWLSVAVAAVAILLVMVQPFFPASIGKTVVAVAFQWLILGTGIAVGFHLMVIWLPWRERRHLLLICIMVAVAGAAGYLYLTSYLSREHDIKFYDSTLYWIKVIEDRQLMAESIIRYLAQLRRLMALEYTNLAAFPLIPASYIFGLEFTGFCHAIFFVYYLPACLFTAIFCLRLLALLPRWNTDSLAAFAVCLGTCCLGASMAWPLLNGYVDVAGVLLMACMLNLAYGWRPETFRVGPVLALAAVSLLLLLTRRWYAYYIVGFYIAVAVTAALGGGLSGLLSLRRLGTIALNLILIAALCSLCIVAINPEIFIRFLGMDYGTVYLAYKTKTLWSNLWLVALNVGYLWIALAGAGAVILVAHTRTRRLGVLMILAVTIAVVLFRSVQDLLYHHHYLVLPTILIAAGVCCGYAMALVGGQGRYALALVFLTLSGLNFSFAYEPSTATMAAKTIPVLTALRAYPKVTPNIDLITTMTADLERLVGDSSAHVYVVGDSNIFSPEMLKRNRLPEKVDAAPFVMVNNIVDLRDGFPSHLFMAEYVLLSDPLLTEFNPPQEVSRQVHDMFRGDRTLARYYRLEKTYTGVEANFLLYKKIRPIDPAVVDILRERLRALYPETPRVYQPNYFTALFQPGDRTRFSFNLWDDQTFIFEKDPGHPIEASFDDTVRFTSLSFLMSCWLDGLELVVRNQERTIARVPVTVGQRVPYAFDIFGSERLTISIAEAVPGTSINATVILNRPELR